MLQKKKKADRIILISDNRFSPITPTIVDESMNSTSTNPINNENETPKPLPIFIQEL